ncbi:amidohydrolase family protein [Pseudomonas sp. SST3]|jgi:aminocarboxymuconate-semialdehyde decarboxylase|uniref:amidohydrolase family protein n=1 Tax=Pseudomonas sp. SST3 TaxID=2267882 RepID=UPI000E040001|nr:amidohydrolase family protein [Pseudomonas sp. SST3]NKQ12827.1 amidohydrolase [Pseudomonas sp. SST3]
MIDCHTHVVPADFPAYLGRDPNHSWPCMQCCEGHHRTVMIRGKPFREVSENAWDGARRVTEMADEGIERQVLSPMPELLSYWFDVEDAVAFCRYMNGTIAELVGHAPDRFYGLGMVPLQDPERAAREVRSLKYEFGLVGIEVGSNVNGVAMGDRRFDPFFEALQEEDMCLFVHALHPNRDRLYGLPLMEPLVAFPNENSIGIVSFLANGVTERFPRLRVAFSHGGGAFPMTLPRLQHGWEVSVALREAMHLSPVQQARSFWYDTLVYSERAIAYLLDVYGASRLMIGTDYPFVIRESYPGRRLEGLGISEADKTALTRDNCLRFLGLIN